MPLAIRISRTGAASGNSFRLQASTFTVTHELASLAAKLPGVNPILIDLGQWSIAISIEGIANNTGTDLLDGAIAIADKDDLENMADPTPTGGVIRWFDQTITISDETISGSFQDYTVKLSKLQIVKRDAQNFWTFSLMAIGNRV
ncbi:MAG: hypothetical protein AABY07_06255 [Nanoarchaeota archaeon]